MTPASAKVQAYRRTLKGLVTLIYANQKMTAKKYGRPAPAYTKKQFRDWLTSQSHFQQLFDDWEASGYTKNKSPSVDRLDNTQSYTLNNIQLTTSRQNLLNQKNQNISGEYLHTKSKRIRQLDLHGNILAEYGSIAIAARTVNGRRIGISNISAVANGKWLTAYGYKWQWA